MAELRAELMADWITDDTHKVDINKEVPPGEAKGEIQNPSFPATASANEDWSGTIDIVNVGDASGTFRYTWEGEISETRTLDAGQRGTAEFWETGPAEFTIKLQRKV